MDVELAISEINYALRGLDDDAPVDGSEEWNYWVSVLNRVKRTLFRDVKQNWAESFEVRSIGTVTASASLTFNLPADFLAPSGDGDLAGAFVVTTDGTRVDLDLVKPQQATSSKRQLYIAGANPQVLYFSFEVESGDQIVGGELFLPGYFMPADAENAGDPLVFPDNDWGVAQAAAEIAFNDLVYEDKTADLNAKANSLYEVMVNRNQRGYNGSPRKVQYAVRRLGT